MSMRRTHIPEFKARVAMEAIRSQDDPGDCRRPRHPPDLGEPVEAAASGRCQRAVRQSRQKQGQGEVSDDIWLRGRADLVDRFGGVQLNPVAMRWALGHACSPHRSTDCAYMYKRRAGSRQEVAAARAA